MKFKDFLLSKTVLLCFYFIFIITLAAVMAAVDVGVLLIVMTAAFLVVAMAAYIIVTFIIEKKKLDKINKLLRDLPDKHLLAELLPEPKSAVERQYFSAMKTVSRSALGVAETAVREKDEYCEYVERWVHEFKTPLTACRLILNNDSDVHKLKRELKRAENLTENILFYARLKSADKDLSLKKFNVRDAVENAVKSQAEILIAAGISIEVDGGFEVYSDSKSLEFILRQLLVNCAKYAAKGKVKIIAQNQTVTVEDNGIGIPSHELSRVTHRGFTGTNGRNCEGSTGMGLYIARGLCDLLDINLQIDSEVDVFTRVALTFATVTKL